MRPFPNAASGTIGAVANNGVGIAGLNWQVKLISCKFLGSNGSGYTSDAVLCFQNVKALKQGGLNIRLTSNSWGGGGFSQELKNAMSDVEALGVVNVCAAGNSGLNADASPMYPAGYDNRGIISVLASEKYKPEVKIGDPTVIEYLEKNKVPIVDVPTDAEKKQAQQKKKR